ncbi:MAG: alanine racemase [Candidatus Aminicenantes bacterium]|nr:alanine racemase [Candidatus Aminicenantes bacterium]
MNTDNLNTWIELSEDAYVSNFEFFRRIIPKETELAVVVKANAYGHGLKEIAEIARKNGVRSYCVHTLDEALLLRKWEQDNDILIMGPVPHGRLSDVINNNFRLVVYTPDILDGLNRTALDLGKSVRIHLKLETGTYRQGMNPEDVELFLEKIKRTSRIILEGVYTHFANIEDTTDHSYAQSQLQCFKDMTAHIQRGYPHIKKHAACSAAALLFSETHFDIVRIGLSMYGLWPSRETFVSYKINHAKNSEDILRPILSWKARVGQVKNVPAHKFIGYGCSYQTTRKTRIAVLPIGYADGFSRSLSNQAFILLHGRRAPVRGRICMNLTMVDITDIPDVKPGDEAVLIGKQGKESISVELLASLAGTINYEFLTHLNGQIPRIITKQIQ